jgi:hypothetical protein
VSAKHGQSPTVPAQLTRIDDGAIIDALNAAWQGAGHSGPLVAFAIDDDAMLMWLTDRSPAAAAFAQKVLQHHAGTGNDITGRTQALLRVRTRPGLRRDGRRRIHGRPGWGPTSARRDRNRAARRGLHQQEI